MSAPNNDRRRAHKLARKVIKFLKEDSGGWSIRLEPLRGNRALHKKYGLKGNDKVGGCSWSKKLIIIDPREDAVSTLIHEVLHAMNRRTPEEEIVEMETLVKQHLTREQSERMWVYASLLMDFTIKLESDD